MRIDEAFAKLSEQNERNRKELLEADNRQWDKLENLSSEVGDIKVKIGSLPCEAHEKDIDRIDKDTKNNTKWRFLTRGGIVVLGFIVTALGLDRLIRML